jgi:hypothetical protein
MPQTYKLKAQVIKLKNDFARVKNSNYYHSLQKWLKGAKEQNVLRLFSKSTKKK